MCKTIKVLKALNVFGAPLPAHLKRKLCPGWGSGLLCGERGCGEHEVLCLCVLLALSQMLPRLAARTQDRAKGCAGPRPIAGFLQGPGTARPWTPHHRIWLDFELLSLTSLRPPCGFALLPTLDLAG